MKLNGFAGEGLFFRRKLWNCQKAKKLYRKQLEEKRERKCNQELKKWDEVYKEIVSRYENVKESQETLTFQEYCLKQWMRKNGVELKRCKITDAKVQNYLDEQAKNNAKNNKAEDPEYNLDVREKREKIGKEIKKKLKIIIGNEYKKLVTMIADKTLLTASNMVFFDLLLERKEDEWKNFVDRRENQLTYQLVQYQLSDIVLEEIIIRGFQYAATRSLVSSSRLLVCTAFRVVGTLYHECLPK